MRLSILRLIGSVAALGLVALAGCGSNPVPQVSRWQVNEIARSEEGFSRRAGDPGSSVISFDDIRDQRKRLLAVSCTIPPELIWEPAEDGEYQFPISKFRLLVPGAENVAPFAIGWGMSGWSGASDMSIQKSKTGKEPSFTIWFPVSPEVSQRTDLRVEYFGLPALPLTEENRFKPLTGNFKVEDRK